jgi:hypothetical protein
MSMEREASRSMDILWRCMTMRNPSVQDREFFPPERAVDLIRDAL